MIPTWRRQVNRYERGSAIPQPTRDGMRIKHVGCSLRAFPTKHYFCGEIRGAYRAGKGGGGALRTDLCPEDLDADPGLEQRYPAEGARKTSGRQAGGGYFAIQFSSDEFGPKDLCLALACHRLDIQREKSMKDVVGEEGY